MMAELELPLDELPITMHGIIVHQTYDADKELLMRVFTSLVGYYGSIVYGSAMKTALKILVPVLHLRLRLACGAFR